MVRQRGSEWCAECESPVDEVIALASAGPDPNAVTWWCPECIVSLLGMDTLLTIVRRQARESAE